MIEYSNKAPNTSHKRVASLLLIVLLVISLSSCYDVATSVYPFYQDRDVLFEKELLGEWNGKSGDEKASIIIKQGPEENDYYVIHFMGGKSFVYIGHLVAFNKSEFLDVIPV